ncbi:MAG: S-layer homology domain-containing protein [Clostridia bacterium]|nr:S-layer homology domain-containing protein [Clostridia bacterium]
MKKVKKILAVLLVALMAAGIATVAGAADIKFTDTETHWAWTGGQIPYLTQKNVLNGYLQDDGSYQFKPDKTITRAEFIKILVETAGLTETADIKYDDVRENDWFYPYFRKAAAQGFLVNYGRSANPNADIPREEAVTLLVRYLNLPNTKAESTTFTDYEEISSYFRNDVLKAVYSGIINGYEQDNGTFMFKPKKTMSRAEALTVIYRAFGCIFNSDADRRDALANTDNNIFTKAGINVKNVTLTGRTIVSEGAGKGTIALTDCTVKGTMNVRAGTSVMLDHCTVDDLVVTGGGRVTFLNGSAVLEMTVEDTTDILLQNGSIGTLNVKNRAVNTTVAGNGTIDNANIGAPGFMSAMVPKEYNIGMDLTASFAATEYSGSSDLASAFEIVPYTSTDGTDYFINFLPGIGGTVSLYYTNSSVVPAAGEFDNYYRNSVCAYRFTVESGRFVTENTFSASKVSSYKYVAVQLKSGPTSYPVVVISNKALFGTGFTKVETSDNLATMSFTAESTGQVLWFYSESGTTYTIGQFLEEYDAKENAMKDAEDVTAGKNRTVNITSRYLKNYPFIVLIAENDEGQYYMPVVLPVGDNGFIDDPDIVGSGLIGFTSGINGKIYYYLSATASLPAPDDFNAEYRRASYRGTADVVKDVEDVIEYSTAYAEKYPYVVICLRDSKGEYMMPTYVYAKYSTGFTTKPAQTSEGVVKFKPAANGIVRLYLTDVETAPTVEEFQIIYNETSRSYKGEYSVNQGENHSVTFDASYANRYPYMVLAFIDEKGTYSYPVVVALTTTNTASGFATGPAYVDASSSVEYSVKQNGYVYFYFTNEKAAPASSTAFLFAYYDAEDHNGSTYSYKGQAEKIDITDEIKADYSYIAIAYSSTGSTSTDGLVFNNPLCVPLHEVSGTTPQPPVPNYSTYGLNFEIDSNGLLTITPKVNATLYYYVTSDPEQFPDGDFGSAWEANGQNSISNCPPNIGLRFVVSNLDGRYMVVCLQKSNLTFYDYVIIDLNTGRAVAEDAD